MSSYLNDGCVSKIRTVNFLALLIGLNLIGASLIVQKVALAYLLARGNDRGLLLVSACLWLLGSISLVIGVQDAV